MEPPRGKSLQLDPTWILAHAASAQCSLLGLREPEHSSVVECQQTSTASSLRKWAGGNDGHGREKVYGQAFREK